MQQSDIDHHCNRTKQTLQSVHMPTEAALSRNVNCKLESHINDVCNLYDNVADALTSAGAHLKKVAKDIHQGKPGWNGHVADLYTAAREAFFYYGRTLVKISKIQYLN